MYKKCVFVVLMSFGVVNMSFATETDCIDFGDQSVCVIENNAGELVDSFVVDNN